MADALGLLRESGPNVAHTEITSPCFLEVSAHHLIKEEIFEDFIEAYVENANAKEDELLRKE